MAISGRRAASSSTVRTLASSASHARSCARLLEPAVGETEVIEAVIEPVTGDSDGLSAEVAHLGKI
jgi:hypothetical protein